MRGAVSRTHDAATTRSTPRLRQRIVRVAVADLPTRYGRFVAVGYHDNRAGSDHVALLLGEVRDKPEVTVRIHSECLTGDALGSLRCDCGDQLRAAQQQIGKIGLGVIVYLRGHEGRGIGLADKLRAYALQDLGWDTVGANQQLGLPVDAREYGAVPLILQDLGVQTVSLMTNNPDKVAALEASTVTVASRVPMPSLARPENAAYLGTKRDRLGHELVL
ncbi:MAG: GTP cyclohydrolase II [Propionibacteriales bacterium]|nr:GTP cyclohydrolase II [Propionibacteriales bacterium]